MESGSKSELDELGVFGFGFAVFSIKEAGMGGYRNLEVYKISFELSLEIHTLTLSLPKFEIYEEGSQIRRSAKSVCANIVEGFALRKYKNEYIHYLYRAYASAEETMFHLDVLHSTSSLKDEDRFNLLIKDYNNLCGKIFKLIQSIEKHYDTPNYLKDSITVNSKQ